MKRDDENMRVVARSLAEVAHTLAAGDRAEERVHVTLTLLRQIVPYDRCALLELTPGPQRAELTVVPEVPDEQRRVMRARLVELLRLLSDERLADGGHAEDELAADGDGAPEPMHLAIPLVGLNQIIGVLMVEHRGDPLDDPYDEHCLRLLSVVAAQLGSYLTTLRLREEEREHARQLGVALRRLEETDRRKDDFLAMLGHELRNPIGAINNALRLMDERRLDDVQRYHQLIDRQIRQLSHIVDDLLDASRVRLGKILLERRVLDLRSAAERWFEAFSGSQAVQSHDVKLELADEPVLVDADPVRLDQVFSNLLTNSLKYTPPLGQIRVIVAVEDGEAVARVRDSGIGMTPEMLATVFELFTQADESLSRSQGGLGLGLPLVRSLVEKHGGVVEARSDGPGRGSEFVVRLPLAESAETDTRLAPRAVRVGPGEPLSILVIEDNADARVTLEELLSIWGHTVASEADGAAGVDHALASPPDVMLVDIGLPKLDGYQVARRLRGELGARCPVMYAMTGYGQPEDRRRALDAGFDAHMVKPVNAFELQQRLSTLRRR